MKQLIIFIVLVIAAFMLVLPLPRSSVETLVLKPESTEIIFEEETEKEDPVLEPISEDEEPQVFEEEVVEPEQIIPDVIEEVVEIIEPIPQNIIYEKALSSVVNIVCPIDGNRYGIATGAIISPEGHILSVAHLTEKLKEGSDCNVRKGSPARDFAEAELLFVPNSYNVATTTNTQAPFDFSLWKIREVSKPLEYWDINIDGELTENDNVLTLSYAAELNSGSALNDLNLLFSITTIDLDDSFIIRSKSTVSAQEGSSGGLLVDPYTSDIRGIIFGVSKDEAIFERFLFSLNPKSINNTLITETGKTIKEYLLGTL